VRGWRIIQFEEIRLGRSESYPKTYEISQVFLYLRFSSKYFSIKAMVSFNARWSLIFPDTTFQLYGFVLSRRLWKASAGTEGFHS
jgi:hypothetical protein